MEEQKVELRSYTWSPTSLNRFLQCTLKYWFEKAQGWRSYPNERLLAGRIVHGVLEDLLKLPAGDRTIDAARRLFMPRQEEFLKGNESRVDITSIRETCRIAINSYFDLEDPAAVELPIDGLERQVSGRLSNVPIGGHIDRIQFNETGLRILDYKTGTPKPPYMSDYWRQQMLYAAVSNADKSDGEVTEVALLYLSKGPRLLVRPVTEFAMNKVTKELSWANEQRHEFQREARWRASVGPLCKSCAFRVVCPAKVKRAPTPGSSESEAKLAESPEVYKREARSTETTEMTFEDKE